MSWLSLLLKRMDWRKNTVRPAQPRLARLAVSRSPPVFPRLLPLRTRFFFIRPRRPRPVDGNRPLPPRRPRPLDRSPTPRAAPSAPPPHPIDAAREPPPPLDPLLPSTSSSDPSLRRRPRIPHGAAATNHIAAAASTTPSPPWSSNPHAVTIDSTHKRYRPLLC
jgi:hypothetical protein